MQQSPESSSQLLPVLENNFSIENYPSEDLLEQFQKIDKLFSEYEYSKTIFGCNQLLKRFKLSSEDSIHIKKLTAFCQFQCNFFYKSISNLIDLLKNCNDTEAKVYLTLFEKSTCLSNLVIDIKQFQGFKQESLTDLAEPASYLHEDDPSQQLNQSFSTQPSLQSLHSIDSPLQSASEHSYEHHGCIHIFKPHPSLFQQSRLLQILRKSKNVLEIEQELIDYTQSIQNTQLVQVILMVLVLEQFNIKESKKAEKILTILLNRYPSNPKYKAGLAQLYVQFADVRNFESVLKDMEYRKLTDFKQNLLFGVQGLIVRNHSHFNIKFLELVAFYLPQLFLEENKSAFTITTLQDVFGFYRQNVIELIKITAYQKVIYNELTFNPINTYLDLYFD